MNDKIKSFMEYVSSNDTLKAELKDTLQSAEKETAVSNIIRFAKEHGHELTKEDFELDREELSLEELEAVVGGGGCCCVFAGNGGGDGLGCDCFLGGAGGVDGVRTISSQGGCACPLVGVGATRRH